MVVPKNTDPMIVVWLLNGKQMNVYQNVDERQIPTRFPLADVNIIPGTEAWLYEIRTVEFLHK